MTKRLRILHLEDDPDFPELVKSLLEQEGFEAEMEVVENFEEYAARLEKGAFDIILADYQLPTCNGLQALRAARARSADTPFVLISGVIGEEAAVESLKSGATDYVLKNGTHRLVAAVRRAVEEAEERRRAAEDLQKAQADLVHASRLAGMAEMATSVLHNVSNVLNSVNVSASLVSDEMKKSRIAMIARVATLMREHAADIGDFLTRDPKGRQVPEYLSQLAEHLAAEQAALLNEMEQIRMNVEHIKDIVDIQQNQATMAGVSEKVPASDLVEEALSLNAGTLLQDHIQVVREFEQGIPPITVERHKVLQILVHVISNARNACVESGKADKRLTLCVRKAGDRVHIAVIDNGVGIPAENLDKLFTQGFTTKKGGHGFGLHSSALTARSLGGALHAHSEGPGQGATVTLELPLLSSPRQSRLQPPSTTTPADLG